MKHLSSLALCALLLLGAGCSSAPTAAVPPTTTAVNAPSANATAGSNAAAQTKPTFCTPTKTPNVPVGDVLALAKEKRASAFDTIDSAGASILTLDGGRTYGVWWAPEGFDPATGTVLVSLHGHGEFAAKGFEVWYPTVKKNNVAYLGIQWWFGRSLEDNGYYETDRIATIVDEAIRTTHLTTPNIIFHGFSMGSARSYGVTAWESLCGDARITVTISESGEWEDGYPMYADMLEGTYGEKPFAGNDFILFCGGAESGPMARGTCDGMNATKARIEQLGGTVTDFLTDPNGGHGSLTTNPTNADAAITAAKKDLEQKTSS